VTRATRDKPSEGCLYCYGKGMTRISTKNQITIPVAALDEVGLHAGERVTVEPAGDGELRIRRSTTTFEDAFGTLTGSYPAGYLEQLDAEDELR
jgi:AbrB family looped-hinge helix DNA binding protein